MLKQKAMEIANKVGELAKSLEEEYLTVRERLDISNNEAREAAAQGDLRENAAYEKASADVNKYTSELASISARLAALEKLDMERYNSVGIVLPYSTVQLKEESGQEYIYMIFPDITLGDNIISTDSRIAKAILGKVKGDVVAVPHAVTKKEILYRIVDIY